MDESIEYCIQEKMREKAPAFAHYSEEILFTFSLAFLSLA